MNSLQTPQAVNAPNPGPLKLFSEWAEMIKVEHTVFALPFALSGLILASKGLPQWPVVLWTILSFAGARAAAMTLNRLIDARLDAQNPRTQTRAIAQGRIKKGQAFVFALASFALMLYSASHLPEICLWLSPIAIFWLSLYSFTKRFTYLCHICLGIALSGAALGGWIAAGGSLLAQGAWLLATAVGSWVAGFDIIYACQDFAVDIKQNLHSIPCHFGLKNALLISRGLHVVTVLCLVLLGVSMSLGIFYWSGVVLTSLMLCYEHSLVSPSDLSRVNAAFFNTNGWVSIATFCAILIDKLSATS